MGTGRSCDAQFLYYSVDQEPSSLLMPRCKLGRFLTQCPLSLWVIRGDLIYIIQVTSRDCCFEPRDLVKILSNSGYIGSEKVGQRVKELPPPQMILWKYKHWLSYSLFKIMISVPERTSSWKLINFRKYKSEHLGISTLYLLLKKCSWVWKTFSWDWLSW